MRKASGFAQVVRKTKRMRARPRWWRESLQRAAGGAVLARMTWAPARHSVSSGSSVAGIGKSGEAEATRDGSGGVAVDFDWGWRCETRGSGHYIMQGRMGEDGGAGTWTVRTVRGVRALTRCVRAQHM